MPKVEIVAALQPGDTVYFVHSNTFKLSGKRASVIKATIQSIDLCEYQGALYCNLYAPSFRRNQHPTVHYSKVFKTRDAAREFAEYMDANPDDVFPVCMGCHYNTAYTGKEEEEQ